NGAFLEAVIMRYDSRLGMCGGNPRPGGVRETLCVSSQEQELLLVQICKLVKLVVVLMKLQIGCDVCLKEGVMQMDLEEHRRFVLYLEAVQQICTRICKHSDILSDL
ncbi:hypothetical protein C5167_038499, partial [Papaver somniferum]